MSPYYEALQLLTGVAIVFGLTVGIEMVVVGTGWLGSGYVRCFRIGISFDGTGMLGSLDVRVSRRSHFVRIVLTPLSMAHSLPSRTMG